LPIRRRPPSPAQDATGYAAILVDLKLPDGDGISLILNLRAKERSQDTPIIVVSIDPEDATM
jgi:DNA-binding response OmpR family regulator